ncbi:4-phosphoerythronate dehydrogenase [Litorivicinus lipolyticus]|uniref:4-phosphoerythronate dehydrogenase n=1 Tax=Litorivicinus lipolyticus TaxID=418701 RepID=UPI003B5BAA5C
MKRIAIDPKLLGAQHWLAPLGTLVPVMGRHTDPAALADVDALVIRSVTRVDTELMAHTSADFVGTTTIGFDHIDRDLMAQRGIRWTNAPGCNALAVADYVESVMAHWCADQGRAVDSLRVAVIGVGGIGRIVAQRLAAMGCTVMLNDPPRHAAGDLPEHVALADCLAQADVISVHVPLITQGPTPTRDLLGLTELDLLGADQLLISAGRGGAVDNSALRARLQQPNAPRAALDVWHGEPDIMPELWPLAWIATPHIAGHALEGKLRGTWMVAQSLAAHWGVEFSGPSVSEVAAGMLAKPRQARELDWITRAHQIYDVRADDARFRAALDGLTGAALAAAFDQLRDGYPKRREIHD